MTRDVATELDESKADRWAYFPFYADDWGGGIRAFTLEQEGFLLRFCRCQWAERGPLRDDIKWLGKALHCDVRTVRRMRDFLVEEKKLRTLNGAIWNPRMQKEIKAKLARDRAKIAQTSGGSQPEVGAKFMPRFRKRPTKSTAPPDLALVPKPLPLPLPSPEPSGEVGGSSSIAEAAAAPTRVGFDILRQKLLDAASDAVARDDVSLRLAELSCPIMWLDQGCDLELDILPTIRAICGRRHDKGIRSWKYFNVAIAEAKATRLAGLPAVEPNRLKETANQIEMRQVMAELTGVAA